MFSRNRRPSFRKDKRRKHHHWRVTVVYPDGEKFARVYTDHKRATAYAERQRRSPIVKLVRVTKES